MSSMMLHIVIISFDFIIEDDNASFFSFFELGYTVARNTEEVKEKRLLRKTWFFWGGGLE